MAVTKDKEQEEKAVRDRMALIKHAILVLSGKGGVGKSAVAVNLATEFAREGKRVGILDVDIHGPSIPGMFGLDGHKLIINGDTMLPILFTSNLSVMSIGFLLQDRSDAVIWRGPMKHGIIRQFIANFEWGELDYLIVDCPPGTGDEPLSIAQIVGKDAGAIVVTTPQRVSIDDVRKSIQFCRKLDLKILGVIENMSGFICPHCGEKSDIFDSGGGKTLAQEMNVPFLCSIPIEQGIVNSCDAGFPYVLSYRESHATKAIREAIQSILAEYNQM